MSETTHQVYIIGGRQHIRVGPDLGIKMSAYMPRFGVVRQLKINQNTPVVFDFALGITQPYLKPDPSSHKAKTCEEWVDALNAEIPGTIPVIVISLGET